MGKLSDDDAKTLADLLARRDAPDEEDDFEVHIQNAGGSSARMPSKKAAGWLKTEFGIDLAAVLPAATSDGGDEGGTGEPKTDEKPKGGYFGGKRSGN